MDRKRQQKIIKKNGIIKVCQAGGTEGVIKLTRVKLSTVFGDRDQCEVDIVYSGTIDWWGRTMGPYKIAEPYRHCELRWSGVIERNAKVRRELCYDIINHLYYFGVDILWSKYLIIKKIKWVDAMKQIN